MSAASDSDSVAVKMEGSAGEKKSTPLSSSSGRKIRKKLHTEDVESNSDHGGQKKCIRRKCERTGCPSQIPICFIGVSEKCAGSGYTSRWYHLSGGEHYCNECFEHFYRSHKLGYPELEKWKRLWSANAKSEATMRVFMSEKHLPYWVQCNKQECRKWRQLSKDAIVTPAFLEKYVCGMTSFGIKREKQDAACGVHEDQRVNLARSNLWTSTSTITTYLESEEMIFILNDYFPDCVGITCSEFYTNCKKKIPDYQEASKYVQPFLKPDFAKHANAFHPAEMSLEEMREFPEHSRVSTCYLPVRNLILTLWCSNPLEWLSVEQCSPRLICRGLNRIFCISELQRIWLFLTKRGYINYGLVSPQHPLPVDIDVEKKTVLIIGAGTAGLSAARNLKKFGLKCTVLEADERIGGRIYDEDIGGIVVGRGAQILAGCKNNPFAVMCEQAGLVLKEVRDHCDLLSPDGTKIDSIADKRLDFHFNALLDIIAEWRKNKDISQDINLYDKFMEMHQQFLEESLLTFSKDEEEILQFHIGNLEYACGCCLKDVSALSWDQNEDFPQFSGFHALLTEGFTEVLRKMSEGLDVRLNSRVSNVMYDSEYIKVTTTSGHVHVVNKVLVTVPLSVLKKRVIKFHPALPEEKMNAIDALGAGCIEKVILQFDRKFWKCDKLQQNLPFFGRVPGKTSERGLFAVFYDVTVMQDKETDVNILTSPICGEAIEILKSKTDDEIVLICVNTLKELFPEQVVPEPLTYRVTRWYENKFHGMAYSYLPTGLDGSVYDIMSQGVEEKIFFAGEATNRQHPQTITGAYLSGIRESVKILESFGT